MCAPARESGRSRGANPPAGRYRMDGMVLPTLLVSAAALGGGFAWTKGFVRRRLRFVDAVYTRPAPWIAGAAAALVATPLTLLPVITGLTAVGLGVGVAFGVKVAQRDRFLPPGDE